MDFKERISKLTIALGINKTQLQEETGLSNAYFANVNRVSGRVAAQIKARYPQINIEWLNEGIGEMFLDNKGVQSNYTVPLVPVSALAGSLSMFTEQVHEYDCERIVSPIKDASLAISISGESMSPEYPNGCKVLLKKINEKSFIEWGRTYVLDTQNGTVIKNVYPCKEHPDKVVCRSINQNYPDFEVSTSDINGWYRVMMQISLK